MKTRFLQGSVSVACLAHQKYAQCCVAVVVLGALRHVWLRGDGTKIPQGAAKGRDRTGQKGSSKPFLETKEKWRGRAV